MTSKIKVLQFSYVINKNDFIDVIIRHADSSQFSLSAIACMPSNIADPDYDAQNISYQILNKELTYKTLIPLAQKLASELRKNKIDILHTHHFYETVIGRIACILSPGTKLVFGRHYHNEFYITAKGLRQKYYLAVESWLNKTCSKIVSPSSLISDLLKKQGVAADKIVLIPYAFDFAQPKYQSGTEESVRLKRAEFSFGDQFVVGCFARHHPIKGLPYLIKAFGAFVQKYPTSKLLMVGDGSVHKDLVALAESLGLAENVVFTGWRKDASELMKAVDVIVHPTLQEAFPQLMIEAMALKKPLVITPVSGATDVIENDVNGIIVPFKDAGSITNALTSLYENTTLRTTLGINACHTVTTRYNIDTIIPQFEQLYQELTTHH